jgi:hypothetical protein
MRISRSLSIVLALAFASACDEIKYFPCDKNNLYTIDAPVTVESFEVRDGKGQTLWKFVAVTPTKLSKIRYGEVPPNYTQTFPSPGVHPRDFVKNEDLSTVILTARREYMHEGMAMGPGQFCGGYNEGGPRKQ